MFAGVHQYRSSIHHLLRKVLPTQVLVKVSSNKQDFIEFNRHVECECGLAMTGKIPDEWLDIARKIKIPYNEEKQFHPEFDGYIVGDIIKQADVVLLGYPLMYVKDAVTRRNDLEIYEAVTRPDGPAMTWSMHSIGYLELKDEAKAAALLNRSYQPYVIEPFKVKPMLQ